MVRDVGPQSAGEMVRAFIDVSGRQFSDMQGLAAAGQAEEVTPHAHALARLARNVGLMRLSRATAELEGAIASGSGELAARLLVNRSLLFACLDELRNWRPPEPL
ncbi:MAG TPA: Hpt domain-containing protein [Acetobacteraceae bacterium]|jgi:HPt (histidine-containing phosphotransfer) domain-containing protein